MAAIDQLAADSVALSDQLRQRAGAGASTGSVFRAAAQAAGAAAAQLALQEGQEVGSAPAAASKAAAVLLEAAGVVAPSAQYHDLLQTNKDTAAQTQAVPDIQQPHRIEQQKQHRQQTGATSADAASRLAAELSCMQVLLVMPYTELICFVDLEESSAAAGVPVISGHRCVAAMLCWRRVTVYDQVAFCACLMT